MIFNVHIQCLIIVFRLVMIYVDIVFIICDNDCPSLDSLQGTLQHFRLDVQDSGDGLR